MSKCDYSTVVQECSGFEDKALHPGSSPAGAAALPVSTKLQLLLSQPDGIMLMSASTGVRQISACSQTIGAESAVGSPDTINVQHN